MASSGGMWHNAKSGGRVFGTAGESRAKASVRAQGNEFKRIVGPRMKAVAGRVIGRRRG